MQTVAQRRLANEYRLLERALPTLTQFVRALEHRGAPPTLHRFELLPFGFLVATRGPEPEPYAVAAHGSATLVAATDPRVHPQQPWRVWIQMQHPHVPFSPHIGTRDLARGAVCWTDAQKGYGIGDWPVHCVLIQSLRILAGEAVAFEGYALNEDAKAWYARNRQRMPLARVPEPNDPHLQLPIRAPANARTTAASNLGIEFGDIS